MKKSDNLVILSRRQFAQTIFRFCYIAESWIQSEYAILSRLNADKTPNEMQIVWKFTNRMYESNTYMYAMSNSLDLDQSWGYSASDSALNCVYMMSLFLSNSVFGKE